MDRKENCVVVSVVMITYNHEKYIAEAIKGALMQQTSFPIELIICNDASTDGTDTMVEECIKNENKGKTIRYFNQEQNLGMVNNFILALEKCNGDYIAICEGDDYWTDPLKLQKQVDFLEANKDYSICCHEVKKINEDGGEGLYNNINENKSFNIIDLVHNNFMAAVSCVFRAYEHHNPMPAWFTGYAANDYGLKLLNATKGKIYYIKDCMAVYRVHSGGIWSSQPHAEMYENGIKVIDSLNAAFNHQYNEAFEQGKKLRFQRFFPPPAIIAKPLKYSGIKSKIKYYLSKILSH